MYFQVMYRGYLYFVVIVTLLIRIGSNVGPPFRNGGDSRSGESDPKMPNWDSGLGKSSLKFPTAGLVTLQNMGNF